MLSFGRGIGLSFRAGDDMSPFKVETTRAFLNLFPRSKITKSITEHIGTSKNTLASGWLLALTNLKVNHWLFAQCSPGLKDQERTDVCEVWLLWASDSQVSCLYAPGHAVLCL